MSRIKVALVHYMFSFGGAERVVSEIASALNKEEFEVRVICIYGERLGNEMETKVELAGASISYLRLSDKDNPLVGISRLWRELDTFAPDVIHSHLGALQYCIPWILTHRAGLVHTIHNNPAAESPSPFATKMMKVLYKRHRAIPVAISANNQILIADYYGLPISDVEMVNNPVDTDFFHPSDQKLSLHRPFRFINVAGLRKQKKQSLLIKAFSKLVDDGCNVELVIVGGGEEENALHALAGDLGISQSVIFKGQVSRRDELRRLLWNSDAFVLSSEYEGLPISALEAMSCSLPVISTDVGGMSDIVDSNGILVPINDASSLSEAMVKLVDDHGLRLDMGERSREIAKKFDLKSCSDHYADIYRKQADKWF